MVGHGGEACVLSVTEVKEQVFASSQKPLQAARISRGIYFVLLAVAALPDVPHASIVGSLWPIFASFLFFFSRLRLCLPPTFSPRRLEAVQ